MKTTMKRWLAVILAVALLCSVLPFAFLLSVKAADDLLTNGGFEDGLTGWSVGGGTALSDDAYSGDKALKLTHASAWGEALTRYVAVEKNTEYTLSFRVKRVSGSGVWHSFVLDTSDWSALTAVSGQSYFTITGSEWKTHSITVNSGDRTQVMLKFCPETKNGGVILVDDIVFTSASVQPDVPDTPDTPDVPVAGLTNGGFEDGTTGWSIGGGTALSNDAHSGNQSLLMAHTNAWGEALTRYVAVEKNTDYTLTFWVKRESGSGVWNVYALNPTSFAALPATKGDLFFNYTAKEWVCHSITFNSGDLEQVMLKFCPETKYGGTFLIDDISLTAKGEEPDTPDNPDTPDTPVVPATGLTNGGFEDGTNGWSIGGDTALSDDARSGSQSLLLSHTSAYGEALLRTVGVEKNTEYVLTFWVKRVSGGGMWNVYALHPTSYAALKLTSGESWFTDNTKDWVSFSISFNTDDLDQVILKFCPETKSGGTFLIDDITLTVKGEQPDVPDEPVNPPAQPLPLTSFAVLNNRPISEEYNAIVGSGFASAEGAQWNTDTFLADNVTVVADATREDGYALYFNTSGTTKDEWHIFWVDIEPNTDYIFSAWVKGAYLSANSLGRATIGVVDPDTQKFMVHKSTKFSNSERQIVPPAWDDEWHLRSVSFNSGEKTRVGIALMGYGTQLWVDDLSLHRNEDGLKYMGENATASVKPNFADVIGSCQDEDNMLQNGRLDEGTVFWQEGAGWKNGFLSVQENDYEYGASLKYTASADPVGVHYVQWVDIQPNTEYTFSVDLRILESGDGKLVLMDGKKQESLRILQVDFSQFDYGEDWFRVTYAFNSSSFTTLGIGVVDGGGEVLLDNFRLFETEKGVEVEDAYIDPPYTPEQPDSPDSPDTGVATAALVMAALLPVSAAVAIYCRKRKRA